MRVKRLGLAVLSLALVTACGQSVVGQRDSIRPAANPSYGPITPAEACPKVTGDHLPAEIGAVKQAFICGEETRRVPGDGEWSFDVVRGVTSGLDELLQAYAVPDEALGGHTTCTLDLPSPLDVVLRADRTLVVRAPRDDCSKPTTVARQAYAALGLTELGATKRQRVQSELGVTSGCPDKNKDMLAVEEEMGGPSRSEPAPEPITDATKICSYDVVQDSDGDPVGQVVAVRPMTPALEADINAALADSHRDSSCARHGHRQFALIFGGRGGTTLIAIDGCAVQQDDGWWRATDKLRELVAPD
ncbi:MAG: hypothetical protein JWN31_1803 [Frankiales bacterium]|nr:hypothetical protein [Frankiales bacterium]